MAQDAQIATSPDLTASPVAETFLNCLAKADHHAAPFDYWLLHNPLPSGFCDAITSLPFDPPAGAEFDGRRETNNSTRVYFTPENQAEHEVCRRLVEGFEDPRVRRTIEEATGTDLSDGHLRIEYCQDTAGFWLEPPADTSVKKFTRLVYRSDVPGL